MNTGSVSQFGCYYCQTTFLNFTEAILHSTLSHWRSGALNSIRLPGKLAKEVIPKEHKTACQSIQADPSDE